MIDTDMAMQGLANLFQFHLLLALVVGFTFGFIVGAIPGFNDANLMAILLPLSIYLDATDAIVLMSALYFSAQAAGSIPAILINIPGTGGNAASTIEGYALARQGRSGYALGISIGASSFGAAFGALASLLVAPILGMFALSFGPAELFLLAVFGVTVVGALAGADLLRAVIAVLLGILLAFVGTDTNTGHERATFDILPLVDGFSLIPVILGLYGVPELIDLLRRQSIAGADADTAASLDQDFGRGFVEAFRYRLVLASSSMIGLIIGIVPGAGAAIGSFISYGFARQVSRRRHNYGKGEPEGLVATDCANNAVACGAVIPLLTLGLPGSASTTVMLAAMILHGVRPGPQFFAEFQVQSYTILWSFFVSAALIVVVGLSCARWFRRVVFVPNHYLVPVVLLLLLIGAYANRYVAFDLLVMVLFGLLGMAMRAGNYPVPAFLLAFILAPLLEANYLRAVRIGGHEIFFASAISIVLIALALLSLAVPIIAALMRRGRAGR